MRTLGDRIEDWATAREARRRSREVAIRMEHVELAQHARDRREEREAIALGLIDLGEQD